MEKISYISALEELEQTVNLTPAKITITNVNEFIRNNKCLPITSHSMRSASTNDFHPEGLFSEEIFGQVGTPDRLVKFGYIDLNTKVFHPLIYKTIMELKQLYVGILEGKISAVFDEEEKDFIRVSKDDKEGDTGYSFFIKHWEKVELVRNESVKRSQLIDLILKYKDRWYIDKQLVEPAGLRDIEMEEKVLAEEDVNKLYLTLLSYSFSIPKNSTNRIYDGLRINIQKKVYEIYRYIMNILEGKKGYLRGTYARRKITWGTRNVISAIKLHAVSPNDPRTLSADETAMPLYQTMVAYKPLVAYYLKIIAFSGIFTPNNAQVSVINKEGNLEYINISPVTLEKFTTSDGIYEIIDRFQNKEFRHSSVTIMDENDKEYELYKIHDLNDDLVLFRNIDDLKNIYKGEIRKECIRTLTWGELMYMATYKAVADKHIFVTRYPIGQGDDSTYPTKVRLISTQPNRLCRVLDPTNPELNYLELPNYPIIGQDYRESTSVHPSRLSSLSGDMDGDTISNNSIMGEDSNREISEYLHSLRDLITPNNTIYTGANTDVIGLTLYNLSRLPKGVVLKKSGDK